MDVSEMLGSQVLRPSDHVELTGWLVDTNDGLYILGDHHPENYAHTSRVLVENGDIIYPILEKVPSLGGGWSLLFHHLRADCILKSRSPWLVKIERLSIEVDRDSGRFVTIDIDPAVIANFVKKNGYYKFNRPRNPFRDWLDD